MPNRNNVSYQKNLKSYFQNLDKAWLFPITAILLTLLIFLFYGWKESVYTLFFYCLFHRVLLLFYPYIKDSPYYHFQAEVEQFYEVHRKIKPFLSKDYQFYFRLAFLVSLNVCMASVENVVNYGAISILFSIIVFLNETIEVINIWHRPKIPKDLLRKYPTIQRRYGPFTEVLVHKVLPTCGKGLFIVGSLYTFEHNLYKRVYGVGAIDPLTQIGLSKFHKFPSSYEWSELKLQAWNHYSNLEGVKDLPYNLKVESFIQKEKEFTQGFEKSQKFFLETADELKSLRSKVENLQLENKALKVALNKKN